jgi:hypothetical protein
VLGLLQERPIHPVTYDPLLTEVAIVSVKSLVDVTPPKLAPSITTVSPTAYPSPTVVPLSALSVTVAVIVVE